MRKTLDDESRLRSDVRELEQLIEDNQTEDNNAADLSDLVKEIEQYTEQVRRTQETQKRLQAEKAKVRNPSCFAWLCCLTLV